MNPDLILSPRKVLNKAFLKVKPNRTQIESFKANLILLIDGIKESESEEFHKNLVSDFLKNTYYLDRFFINTKEREDLTIYNGKDSKSSAGVIVEAKKPSNKYEMISKENINAKALHELILYYLRERISQNNLEVKQLIATNIYEWFIFDASVFEKAFAQNKALIKQFTDFEEKRLSGTNTDFFYKEIAAPLVEKIKGEISFTYFNLREIEKPLKDNRKDNDSKLIPYFKVFSPEHMLKLSFSNDSNNLDRGFYNELLHIIGLEETKDGSKKLIGRKAEGKREAGSLIENVITILQYEDCLSNVKRSDYGSSKDEQLYNVALELVISWINRILFLKLLEGQLVQYHSHDQSYQFLNASLIPDYDALNKLFFQVLAVPEADRNELAAKRFARIPYLNSSLFEPNELEHKTIRISNLEDEYTLNVLSNTVLKDNSGKRVKGEMNALHYLFAFLDAYDFASEGSEEIQEENKTLINASVLGLIFEKINGYKDGSFFTPGFITMYMCRETIRRAVLQKFNEAWGWTCNDFDELKEDLFEEIKSGSKGRETVREEANAIVNSLHICDPAVGSGHFLVSALNELIAIKSELRILSDREGKPLTNYTIEIASDELIITNFDDELFEYRPGNRESQRVQETMFHEKQTIIENCLFGVDINPNSVKICRLRLWIELLKNAYYKNDDTVETRLIASLPPQTPRLETLPNIDINIKCGNSLISRYALDADIKKALRKSKWTIDSYRLAVMTYRNARSKDEKRAMEKLIGQIKNDFESEIAANDKRLLKLNKLKGELYLHSNQQGLFELGKTEKKIFNKKTELLTTELRKLETELEEITNNRIYENAFEWRFEFPEVLNDEGDFVGFDVVIGNPPYMILSPETDSKYVEYVKSHYIIQYKPDLYHLFFQLGIKILHESKLLCFITPSGWLTQQFTVKLRELIAAKQKINNIVLFEFNVFEEADVKTSITFLCKRNTRDDDVIKVISIKEDFQNIERFEKWESIPISKIKNSDDFVIEFRAIGDVGLLIEKIRSQTQLLNEVARVSLGCQAYNSSKHSRQDIQDRIFHSDYRINDDYLPELAGSDVGRYYYQQKKGQWIKYGPWLHDYRTIDWLMGPRILVREIISKDPYKINCVYIEETFCNYKTILNVNPTDQTMFSFKYLCGVLNSKLISFIYSYTSNKIEAKSFPRLSVKDLRNFPIKNIDFSNSSQVQHHLKIDSLVENIQLELKDATTNNVRYWESEIDLLVYRLYQLTWDEVQLVDPEFAMGREEYDGLEP